MSDENALLAAIRANPDEDTPRLAYADWLDEHAATDADRARGEFIRMGCEHARIGEDVVDRDSCARQKALAAKFRPLEKLYGRQWGAALTGKKGPLRGRECFFHFRRGFPDRAYAPVERLVTSGDELFRLAPITEVTARDVTADNLAALLACPWLANVRSLILSGPYQGTAHPDWEQLADCPYLRNVTYVYLDHGRLTRSGAARLAAADALPRLRRLLVSNLEGGDACIPGLFGGPVFGQLSEVYFHKCGFGTAAAEALAAAPWLTGVVKLSLPNQPLPVEAVRALTAARFWPGLRELVLWHTELGNDGLGALAVTPPERLRRLNVNHSHVNPDGVAALVESPLLNGLEVLDLSSNAIWDWGVERLVRSSRVGNLLQLHLSNAGLGPDAMKALADCPALSSLSWLTLHSNSILAEGATALAESPHLAGLDYLCVSNIRGKARAQLRERFGDRVRF